MARKILRKCPDCGELKEMLASKWQKRCRECAYKMALKRSKEYAKKRKNPQHKYKPKETFYDKEDFGVIR